MSSANTGFQIGNTTYSFDVAMSEGYQNNVEAGYFTVKEGDHYRRISSSDMLFLVYAMCQIRQSEKVERYSTISSALADLAAAASNLNKNFSLMATAFDGEYFKQGIAPDGSIGVYNNVDKLTNSNSNATDVNTRYGMMSPDMIKEVIKDYAALMTAFGTLSTPENSAILADLSISMDSLPGFPLATTGLGDFAALLQKDSFTAPGGTVKIFNKNLTAFDPASRADLEKTLTDYFGSFGIDPSVVGIDEHTLIMDDNNNRKGDCISYSATLTAKAFNFTMTEEGQIDLNNDTNLANLAYCILATTDSTGNNSNGSMLTAAEATNLKETYNNLMNKTNSSTQAMTQYSSRELSKLESVQSMVDRNMSSIFDTFRQIATGY